MRTTELQRHNPQDTPAAKLTYAAAITVPSALTALMSAVPQDSSKPSSGPSGTHTFHFKQDVPIPSYLLALAIGELEYRQIGPKSKVMTAAVCWFQVINADSMSCNIPARLV